MVPPAGFKPTSNTLEECCLIQLDHGGILFFIIMKFSVLSIITNARKVTVWI